MIFNTILYGVQNIESLYYFNEVGHTLKTSILQTASDIGIDIAEMECMPDHIHLLVDCSPQALYS